MDVVRSNIEKIGGSVEMNSVEGKGTSFIIKIPLTLAIVSALIVGIDGERFAIPQLDVRELVLVRPDSPNRIENINGAPVLRLRDRILPLIGLRTLLGFPAKPHTGSSYIAVIHVGPNRFGIIVDRVFDTEEIVVKPVSRLLNNQAVFSGNTILGDGQVIMILDSSGMLKASGIAKSAMQSEAAAESKNGQAQDEIPLLLFNSGGSRRAVPLRHVARLEEIDLAKIELAGGQRVIQYCGALMPIYLSDASNPLPQEGRRPVIVFKAKNGLSGLLVDRILDITAFRGEYQIKAEGALEGSAIIEGKTTDIVSLGFDAPPPPTHREMPVQYGVMQ
jgi:two-component system chemotaxis sensor kinase CheA